MSARGHDHRSRRYQRLSARRHIRESNERQPQSPGRTFADQFGLLLSPETLHEIQRVLADKEMRSRHGQTHKQIDEFCRSLALKSRMITPMTEVPPSLTRDMTDTKFVALALDGNADYLVTLDRRHLQRLRKIGRTQIVRPRAFLKILNVQTHESATAQHGPSRKVS